MSWAALHGFLGSPSDWDFLPGSAAPDLFSAPWNWNHDLEAAGDFVNEGASAGSRWLVGYSMGARIAMQALLRARPGTWKGAVLVSGHPGLPLIEREARRASDEAWAGRFEICSPGDWASLVEQWNGQSVFSGTRKRAELPAYDRRGIYARALRAGSLGRQEDLREALRDLDLPVLWVSGARDRKFSELAAAVARPGFHLEIEGAGHRVPWDAPEDFVKAVSQFKEKYE